MTTGCVPVYPQSWLEAVGYYRTQVVVLSYDALTLENLLPRRLQLASQSVTAPGTHPLVFLFGNHSDVKPNIWPLGGMNYLEFVCAIPFVEWTSTRPEYRGPFAYMPVLYLDQLLPTALGWLYAYPKEWARVNGGPHYEIRTLGLGESILRGDFSSYGPLQPPDDFANFANMRAIFEQPFIGKLGPSPYICSRLDFKLAQAQAQASSADIEIQREFRPGFIPGAYHLDGIDTDPLGAFYLELPWTLTPPFACSCVKCQGAP